MVAAEQLSPKHDSSGEGNGRKRVCKACDRCRLKKSKCDGASPCGRCNADDSICFFGERKKSHDKVYPKGYVELLEQQQAQLVAGIQESYRRLRSGEGWTGSSLKERSEDGRPSVHDILERLDVLGQSWDRSSNPSPTTSRFEEDPFKMQQSLIANGAPPMVRHSSISSDSDHSPPSPASYHNDPICSPRDSFNKENDRRYQPTTPASSQESHLAFYSNQPTTHMLKSYQRSMPHANAPSTMDPALLQRQQQQQQQQQTHHVWPNAPLSTSDFNSVLNGHPFYNTGPSMSYYPTHQDSFSTHSSNRPSLSRNDPCLTTGALPVLDEEMWGQEGYFDNREIVA